MNRPTQTLSKKPASLRHRRIGRKVLLADKLAHVTNVSTQKSRSKNWRTIFAKPKLAAGVLVGVIAVGVIGFAGMQTYASQQAKAKQAEQTAQFTLQKEKAAKADACRRAKLEQKSELIGKVTYDELYDGNECDR